MVLDVAAPLRLIDRPLKTTGAPLKFDTPSILTIAGGVFYVIGGAVVALMAGSLDSILSGSGGLFSGLISASGTSSIGGSGIDALVYAVAVFGIVSGLLIIFGGILFTSPNQNRRKLGGILTVVMMLIGGLATLGGLIIGFILTAIGAYMAYTSKGGAMTVGMGPLGSVTVGRQADSGPGRGPTNYCTRCGSKLKPGAVFCGACGERVT